MVFDLPQEETPTPSEQELSEKSAATGDDHGSVDDDLIGGGSASPAYENDEGDSPTHALKENEYQYRAPSPKKAEPDASDLKLSQNKLRALDSPSPPPAKKNPLLVVDVEPVPERQMDSGITLDSPMRAPARETDSGVTLDSPMRAHNPPLLNERESDEVESPLVDDEENSVSDGDPDLNLSAD